MTKLVGNIEKSAISALRSSALVTTITDAVYDGYTQEDAQAAVTEFLGHLTLSNEDAVKTACGDYFDKIQSALSEQEQTIATQLADKVIEDDKASVKSLVQKYVNSLQYKHSIDNGQDVPEAESAEAVQAV
ncbi:hypothetical protein [Pantoea sp. BAV 3049]|uniref:hypothetical protein n=1 Tax=Pantoea sp. BAV 3049 TaxID=2654188 RepID=UPI00131C7535|nr:hypothetical protein [Pantoea sp. BAV 3049]